MRQRIYRKMNTSQGYGSEVEHILSMHPSSIDGFNQAKEKENMKEMERGEHVSPGKHHPFFFSAEKKMLSCVESRQNIQSIIIIICANFLQSLFTFFPSFPMGN